MVSVEADTLLATKTLEPPSRDLYTLYEMLRPPGFSSGGSQIIVIESSALATTRRFLGGDGGTATMTLHARFIAAVLDHELAAHA